MTTQLISQDGWFSESEVMWPGQRMSLKVENVLFHEKSSFQDVLVFDSTTYGRVLVLDGVIQLTERDEAAYQEMITHLPMFAHKNPKRVLIVGGGDGGVLREVARHECVETITMCEIDPLVCDVSKKFFTSTMATAFNDPRLTLLHQDAAVFLKNLTNEDKYDVIVVDSSDPVGPAESLFEIEFYASLKKALRPDGIVCTQGECIWLHLDLITKVMENFGQLFPNVNYAVTSVPTYPSGQIGFVLSSLNQDGGLNTPKRDIKQEELKYYSKEIHSSAFTLPNFAERKISTVRKLN